MNVYQKLLKARVELQNSDLRKTGKNKHLGFEYFELADFLIVINELNNSIGLMPAFKIENEQAYLTIYNAEKPEEFIVFQSPVAQAILQGKPSPIQELGSQHTYMRRYLYLMAYEIIENDAQDAQVGAQSDKNQNTTPNTNQPQKVNAEQLNALYALAKTKGRTEQEVKDACVTFAKIQTIEQMTIAQYNAVVKKYEGMPNVE